VTLIGGDLSNTMMVVKAEGISGSMKAEPAVTLLTFLCVVQLVMPVGLSRMQHYPIQERWVLVKVIYPGLVQITMNLAKIPKPQVNLITIVYSYDRPAMLTFPKLLMSYRCLILIKS
jgi:hypothetical protein